MLKLEAGKRYWRRDGGVSGPLYENSRAIESMRFCDHVNTWYPSGEFVSYEESPCDLVREYTEPQPLQWKRGIPTEEECRECWIVSGGGDPTPHGMGSLYPPSSFSNSDRRMMGEAWYLALRIQPVEPPPKPKTKRVTQRQYFSKTREELWTDCDHVDDCWTASGMMRTVEVPCE